MNSLIKNIVLLTCGVALGWFARLYYSSDSAHDYQGSQHTLHYPLIDLRRQSPTNLPSRNTAYPQSVNSTNPFSQTPKNKSITDNIHPTPVILSKSYSDYFTFLLREKRFEEAMSFYEDMETIEEGKAANLKRVFLQEMNTLLSQGQFQQAIDAQTEFLNHYYNDIEVFKFLAKTYQLAGEIHESIKSYFTIKLYASNESTVDEIEISLTKLIMETDKRLSDAKQWEDLIELYQLLVEQNGDYPGYHFRLAQIFHSAGDDDNALLTLSFIVDDPQWSAQASALLREMQPVKSRKTAITLQKKGMHYLVDATFEQHVTLKLLIDTGASTTVLSQRTFDAIYNDVNFEFLGYQLMNTANGLTNSSIYRVSEISIDQYTLNDIQIAVLDFQPSPGVNGLLGMNVLKNYHFEIDQEQKLLYLLPR